MARSSVRCLAARPNDARIITTSQGCVNSRAQKKPDVAARLVVQLTVAPAVNGIISQRSKARCVP